MIYSTLILAVSVAAVSAQGVQYNAASGLFSCDDMPTGSYCLMNSMKGSILIQCENSMGMPMNCNDELKGVFPAGITPKGNNFAPCYQSNKTAGDAVCSKNCIAHPMDANGMETGEYPLPPSADCTPIANPNASRTSAMAGSSSSAYTASGLNPGATSLSGPMFSSAPNAGPNSRLAGPSASNMVSSNAGGSSSQATASAGSSALNMGPSNAAISKQSSAPAASSSLASGASASQSRTDTTRMVGPTGNSGTGNNTNNNPNGNNGAGGGITTPTPKSPSGPQSTPAQFEGQAVTNSAGFALVAIGVFVAYCL